MNETRRRESIERGMLAHQAGQFEEALHHYRIALEAVRGDAEALSMSGMALLYLGHHDRAMPLLERAVESEPTQVGFRLNFAEGLERVRQYERARRELQAVLAMQPEHSRALDRLGDIAARLGDEDGAAEGWLKAFSLQPTVITPALKFSQLQISKQRPDLAIRVLDSALSFSPANIKLLALKCEAQIASRDWSSLQVTATQWSSAYPQSPEALRVLARAAFELGRHIEAVNFFSHVLSLTRPTAPDFSVYASLNLHALNYDAAALALAAAEALDPDNADMLATRALLQMYFGQFADAEISARRSLTRDPESVSAYSTLSRLLKGNLPATDREATARMARRSDLHLDIRIPVAFIAAHSEDARGNVDAAIAAYDHAHSLARQRDRAEGRSYDPQLIEKRMQRLRELSAAPLAAPSVDSTTPRPIFIVGMPRSGTTLVESILAAHSRVVGMGERSTMQHIQRAFLALDIEGKQPDAALLRAWQAAYFQDLQPLGAADRFTDKHPLNFEAAGLIAQLLGDAIIVHVRRNPLETGLSIYRQEFNKHWLFAHRFVDIAHYYGCYARQVDHWERTLGSRFVTLQYEDLVANFSSAVPRLLQACGLDWEPQCLTFHESARPISTFSTVQARDPVSSGNGRADRYAKHLGALAEALERARVDLQTGALRAAY